MAITPTPTPLGVSSYRHPGQPPLLPQFWHEGHKNIPLNFRIYKIVLASLVKSHACNNSQMLVFVRGGTFCP